MAEGQSDEDARGTAWPAATMRAPQSPVAVHLYGPGIALSAALMLTPALVALGAVGLALRLAQHVPLALPFALLLLLPTTASAWLAIVSVRTSPGGIGASQPLRPWRDLPWALIAHADRRGPRVTLVASDGRRIRFFPLLLRDGARLYRELLLRLPEHVLNGRMASEAVVLLAEHVLPTAEGGLTGSLHARPRTRWRAAALIVAVGAIIGGTAAVGLVALPYSLGIGVVAGAALAGSLLAYRWCAQTLVASDAGLSVTYPLQSKPEHMAWSEVRLLEHSPGERILRLRGDRRLVCAGPALLRPAERDLLRAFLHAYCLDRGVPVARRHWLFSARGVRHG
ncbi:MAG TPA: hypothetical protein VIG30_01420 [Ktedonobacterales bacterium]|jgi:hypothetical protein